MRFSTFILAAPARVLPQPPAGCRPSGTRTCSSPCAAAFSPSLGVYLLVGALLFCFGVGFVFFFLFPKASLILRLWGTRWFCPFEIRGCVWDNRLWFFSPRRRSTEAAGAGPISFGKRHTNPHLQGFHLFSPKLMGINTERAKYRLSLKKK